MLFLPIGNQRSKRKYCLSLTRKEQRASFLFHKNSDRVNVSYKDQRWDRDKDFEKGGMAG